MKKIIAATLVAPNSHWLFALFLLTPAYLASQAYSPGFKTPFTIINDSVQSLSNYQVLIVLNTATPIAAGHMQSDGDDIRFSADSCNPVIYYDYWIENYINTDSTKIWIKIPQLLPNSSTNFLIWYGDSTANSISNFNSTFPTSFISNGTDSILSGTIIVDWFQLDSGDVISLLPNALLEIRSRVIIMDGLIQGRGFGHSAPIIIGNGNGPGGGGMSNSAAGGGGSYAGSGGTGGYDAGDTPGIGGPVYGLENDLSCFMGSSGGTTDNAMGGAGGAGIKLTSEWISIKGQIDASGGQGIGSIGRCGGGGSGGTIMVLGNNINISSSSFLNTMGGDGGSGSSTANDGGGGGSGGRIKIFHGSTWNSTGAISFLGGSGGLYGSVAFGEDGSLGSYFDSTITFPLIFVSYLGIETSLKAEILGLDSVYCLNKDSILLEAVPVGGSFSGPGIVANYFYPLTAGVGVHAISYLYSDPNGCGNLYDTVIVEVLNIPTFPLATNNGPLCEGAVLNLAASDNMANHSWAGPNGFASSSQFPILTNVPAINDGTYTVTITNSSGCTSSAQTNVTIYPIPDASASNNGPVCLNDGLVFIATGGLSYSWNGPSGFTSATQSPMVDSTQFISQGIYTVTITGIGGCEKTVTTEVVVNGCYDNIENTNNEEIIIFPNPSDGQLWIELPDQNYSCESSIIFYDISGKEVLHKIIDTNIDRPMIDLSALAPGIYILSVRKGHRTSTFKVIRN